MKDIRQDILAAVAGELETCGWCTGYGHTEKECWLNERYRSYAYSNEKANTRFSYLKESRDQVEKLSKTKKELKAKYQLEL